MKRLTHLFLLACIACLAVRAADDRDRFGGWTALHGSPSGYFHAEQIQGVWWLVTPEGNAFYSKGVNNVNYAGDHSPKLGYSPYGKLVKEKYGSPQKWAAATAERLAGWGFNTVGAWSSAVMNEQQFPTHRC